MLTRHRFGLMVAECRKDFPHLREGQAVWATAVEIDEHTANLKRGTDIDPFYHDGRIEAFIDFFLANVSPYRDLGRKSDWTEKEEAEYRKLVDKCFDAGHHGAAMERRNNRNICHGCRLAITEETVW